MILQTLDEQPLNEKPLDEQTRPKQKNLLIPVLMILSVIAMVLIIIYFIFRDKGPTGTIFPSKVLDNKEQGKPITAVNQNTGAIFPSKVLVDNKEQGKLGSKGQGEFIAAVTNTTEIIFLKQIYKVLGPSRRTKRSLYNRSTDSLNR